MKVIIIKDCKDGKKDDIIDVSDGYAKNFLIKKGFALPINHSTKHALNKRVELKETNEKLAKEKALKAKKKIEETTISFLLKTTNNVVHGSISRKQILQKLKVKGIKMDSHAIEQVHIASIGITKIKVKILKDIIAELKVEVKDGGK